MSEYNESGRTKHLLLIVILLVVALLGTGLYYFRTMPSGTTIIDFTDMTKQEVLAWQKENKISDEQLLFEYEYDEKTDKDVVLKQDPEAGSSLKKKDLLTITLSDGMDPEKEIQLIDFKDMNQTEINQWFLDNGFTNVNYVFEKNDQVESNLFVSILPESTKLKRNETITVKISSGKDDADQEVLVPDFSGYTRTNMQAWASTNKINITFVTEASSTVSKGGFIRQSVKAGESIKSNSKITITLSSGKAITVTNQVGQTRAVGEQWAASNGLKVKIMTVYSSDAASGIITNQTPSSGTLGEGDTVTYYVSVGKVPLDNYRGSTQNAFNAYINELNTRHNSSAKITVKVVQVESDETAGKILEQDISGEVNTGSVVSIKVATAKQYQITSYKNQAEDKFKAYLTENKMVVGNRTESYDDTVGAGNIISNDTGTYPAGTKINYQVSLGKWAPTSDLMAPGTTTGALQNAIAQANTKGAGWSANFPAEQSDTYEAGQIIGCTVSGKTVTCTVSNGKVVDVPNTIGQSYEAAKASLETAGFRVDVQNIGYDDSKVAGIVFAQSVSGKAVPGTTIVIRYSDGPKPIPTATLPNIAGYLGIYADRSYSENVAQMTGLFRNAGFTNINIQAVPTGGDSGGSNQNGIESISPVPDGSTIPADTVITIRIYQPDN